MSSVLAGFLVRLGFVVDKDEQAKFQASIDYAGKRMKEIASARRRHGHCVLCCIRQEYPGNQSVL